jgi:long-chain fatty acid transport protein
MSYPVRSLVIPALAGIALVCGSGSVWAGGFAVPDSDVVSAGLGGATVAHPTGAASQFKNVAGLAFLDRAEFSMGGIGRLSLTDFTGASPYPGESVLEKQTRTPLLAPHFAYAQPLSAQLVFGVGVDVPFDFKTAWASPEAFSGRFVAQDASLRCYSITPSVAWKAADRLAIGGGLDINVTKLAVGRRLAAINPYTMRRVDGATLSIKSDTSVALGYRVGILARPSESFAIGVAYRGSAPLDLSGVGSVERIQTNTAQLDNKLAALYPPNGVAFQRDTTLPGRLSAGIAYTWSDWVVAAEVSLERWSSFDSLEIEFADEPTLATTVARAYEDTRSLRVGIERRVNHAVTVRWGYSYEPTPMPVQSLSPVLFDANCHGLALGATFTRGNWRIDLSSGVRLLKRRTTEGISPEGFDGTYKSTVPVLGASFARSF